MPGERKRYTPLYCIPQTRNPHVTSMTRKSQRLVESRESNITFRLLTHVSVQRQTWPFSTMPTQHLEQLPRKPHSALGLRKPTLMKEINTSPPSAGQNGQLSPTMRKACTSLPLLLGAPSPRLALHLHLGPSRTGACRPRLFLPPRSLAPDKNMARYCSYLFISTLFISTNVVHHIDHVVHRTCRYCTITGTVLYCTVLSATICTTLTTRKREADPSPGSRKLRDK